MLRADLRRLKSYGKEIQMASKSEFKSRWPIIGRRPRRTIDSRVVYARVDKVLRRNKNEVVWIGLAVLALAVAVGEISFSMRERLDPNLQPAKPLIISDDYYY